MKYFTFLVSLFLLNMTQAQTHKINFLVGTYTNSCPSKGIYVFEFDANSGDFSFKSSSEQLINPSYLSISEDKKMVYAVGENDEKESGAVALKYNQTDGQLEILNKSNSKSAGSCFIINDDKNVITANYSSGSISIFGKNQDGSLTEVKQVIEHSGKGANQKRQEKPHVHQVYFSPDKKFVLAVDLGTDLISVYDYNPNIENEILKFHSSVLVKSGGGSRHLTFSKDGKYVYVLQELDGSLISFYYKNGVLEKAFETSIFPEDYKGKIQAADIHISPDGKFLYATNRAEMGEISIFKIEKNGKLQFIEQTSTLGKGPRNFAIDPTGNFVLVAHQYSNTIVIFKRDQKTGKLIDSGKKIEICSPVCVVF